MKLKSTEAYVRMKHLVTCVPLLQKQVEQARFCLSDDATVSTKKDPDVWGTRGELMKPYEKWVQLKDENEESSEEEVLVFVLLLYL